MKLTAAEKVILFVALWILTLAAAGLFLHFLGGS